jgi:hypothetical protein
MSSSWRQVLDFSIIWCYYPSMDEITVKQLQSILAISRPTALDIAAKHGVMRNRQWFIPVSVVQEMVDQEILSAQRMQARLLNAGAPDS